MSAIYRKIEFLQPKHYGRDILSNPPSATAFITAGAIAAPQLTGFGPKGINSSPKSRQIMAIPQSGDSRFRDKTAGNGRIWQGNQVFLLSHEHGCTIPPR